MWITKICIYDVSQCRCKVLEKQKIEVFKNEANSKRYLCDQFIPLIITLINEHNLVLDENMTAWFSYNHNHKIISIKSINDDNEQYKQFITLYRKFLQDSDYDGKIYDYSVSWRKCHSDFNSHKNILFL